MNLRAKSHVLKMHGVTITALVRKNNNLQIIYEQELLNCGNILGKGCY